MKSAAEHEVVTKEQAAIKPVRTLKKQAYIHTYIILHSMDPKLAKMTVGCGISHTITKTHIQYN
jgi:hypothetical protein